MFTSCLSRTSGWDNRIEQRKRCVQFGHIVFCITWQAMLVAIHNHKLLVGAAAPTPIEQHLWCWLCPPLVCFQCNPGFQICRFSHSERLYFSKCDGYDDGDDTNCTWFALRFIVTTVTIVTQQFSADILSGYCQQLCCVAIIGRWCSGGLGVTPTSKFAKNGPKDNSRKWVNLYRFTLLANLCPQKISPVLSSISSKLKRKQ